MTKEKVLDRLAQSRQSLQQSIQGLDEAELARVPVEGVWTIRDVLGHIASWEEVCLELLRSHAGGVPCQVHVIEDYMAWNDEQAARKRDASLDDVLDEFAVVRQELVAIAGRLSVEQWEQCMTFPWGGEGTVVEMLTGLCHHELEHLHPIQQWRAGETTK